MKTKNQFNADVCQLILQNIEEGCFPRAAASAAGITNKTLWEWLNDTRPKFRAFQAAYEEAIGRARSQAEKKVFKEDPKFWLRYGPGRERYDTNGQIIPGWGDNAPKLAEPAQQSTTINVITHPAFQAIQRVLSEVLADDPDKRSLIASKLAQIESEKQKGEKP